MTIQGEKGEILTIPLISHNRSQHGQLAPNPRLLPPHLNLLVPLGLELRHSRDEELLTGVLCRDLLDHAYEERPETPKEILGALAGVELVDFAGCSFGGGVCGWEVVDGVGEDVYDFGLVLRGGVGVEGGDIDG